MSYIDKNLLPEERILFRTKKSFIIFFYPVLMTVVAFYAGNLLEPNEILTRVASVPWLVALIFWGYTWLEYQFSDYAVTNKRVMMREGFFVRHSNELRLNTISQVSVNQSIIGQMLNYGMVTINAFGAYDAYPAIASPFAFQQAVNEQLDTMSK